MEIIKLGKKKEARPKPETLGGTMGGGAGENGDCGETVTQRIEKKKIYHKKIKKMYNLVLKIMKDCRKVGRTRNLIKK